jgi:hypothetical protein
MQPHLTDENEVENMSKRDLRHTVEGLVREKREYVIFVVGLFSASEEKERMIGIFWGGKNGAVEEILGEEIKVSYNFMPAFGDASESD